MASALTEQLRKNLFAQSFPEPKPIDDAADQSLDKTTKYAQQTHALLNSQSFAIAALPNTIESKPGLQRAQSSFDEQQKEQNVSKEKVPADEYCLTENKRTKER